MRRLALIAALGAILAGCGGEETVSPTGPVEGTLPKEEPANPAAGRSVFEEAGCGGCHTFEAAKAAGRTGPNLDVSIRDQNDDYVRESIVDPNAEIADGFQPNVMPDYSEQLESKQVADLVAFLQQNKA